MGCCGLCFYCPAEDRCCVVGASDAKQSDSPLQSRAMESAAALMLHNNRLLYLKHSWQSKTCTCFSVTAAHWGQKVIFYFLSLRVKAVSWVNAELSRDLMYLEGTLVIQWNSLSTSSERIWTILSRGPRPMRQRSASVLGINSSETTLNKSADL